VPKKALPALSTVLRDPLVRAVRREARRLMAAGRGSHGFDHVERVLALALRLGAESGADAALTRRVTDCVRRHRYRGADRPASREAKLLFDADKLDSLGAVGVGRAFLFAGEVGARLHNSPAAARRARDYGPGDTAFREWLVKLRHLPGRLLTPAGRRLAADRAAFAAAFFQRLDDEVAGRR
jgi:uncharacterized protein